MKSGEGVVTPKKSMKNDAIPKTEFSNGDGESKKVNGNANNHPTGSLTNSSDPHDLTIFVQDLLEQMQSKFGTMGDSILSRIDEMGSRIDELERSITELAEHSGTETGSGSIRSRENKTPVNQGNTGSES